MVDWSRFSGQSDADLINVFDDRSELEVGVNVGD